MIPKRAIFFWEGPEMSWLRKQSIETFRALNPSWEVEVIDGEGVPLPKGGRINAVWRSDWARYKKLYDAGGVYFDTDIVFCKPIPDEWLDYELILPLSDQAIIAHVAVLGGVAGQQFYRDMWNNCCQIARLDGAMNYQQFGVEMAVHQEGRPVQPPTINGKVKWISEWDFVPVPYNNIRWCWAPAPGDSGAFGIHWFGGDWLSVEKEKEANEEWAKAHTCLVARAWRKAMMAGSSAETLCEQHGIQ